MIQVENVIAWSAFERSAEPTVISGDIDVVASDLFRAVRFYSRVFGLLPAPRSWQESRVVVPVTADVRLVIHAAHAAVRHRARSVKRFAFVVNDLDHVRGLVWELGVKVARDSGAPDHIYRWSNGRSLYVQAPDGLEIELVELPSPATEHVPRRAAAS